MEQEVKNVLGVEENSTPAFDDKNNYEGSGAGTAKILAKIFYIVSGVLMFIGIIFLLNWEGKSYKTIILCRYNIKELYIEAAPYVGIF